MATNYLEVPGVARLYSICATAASLIGIYATASKMRTFGTSWFFWFFILPMAAVSILAPKLRWMMQALIISTALLGGIRVVSIWVDAGQLIPFTLPALWLLGFGVVLISVRMVSTPVKISLWPNKHDKHSEHLWISVVLRPLLLFGLSLVLSFSMLADRGLSRFGSCGGFTISCTVVIACVVPLGSLLFTVFSFRKPTPLLGQGNAGPAKRPAIRGLLVGFLVVYVLGLSLEWSTTQSYLLWSFLCLVALLNILTPVLGSGIEASSGFPSAEVVTRSKSKIVAASLYILVYSLVYSTLVRCIAP